MIRTLTVLILARSKVAGLEGLKLRRIKRVVSLKEYINEKIARKNIPEQEGVGCWDIVVAGTPESIGVSSEDASSSPGNGHSWAYIHTFDSLAQYTLKWEWKSAEARPGKQFGIRTFPATLSTETICGEAVARGTIANQPTSSKSLGHSGALSGREHCGIGKGT